MQQKIIKCDNPDCGSTDVWKSGFIIKRNGKIQRYQCKKCGKLFTDNGETDEKM